MCIGFYIDFYLLYIVFFCVLYMLYIGAYMFYTGYSYDLYVLLYVLDRFL